jgi:peptidoglycan hydrolase-like protein with peptidoglycan-binding domain
MPADPYRFGTRSDATRALQAALTAAGFDAGEADGIFGRQTQAAVTSARAAFGLGAGGVDAALLGRLGLAPRVDPITNFLLRQALALVLSTLKGHFPMNFLAGYRTYIIALIMLLTGVAGFLGIDIPSFSGQVPGDLIIQALAFIFLRHELKMDSKG